MSESTKWRSILSIVDAALDLPEDEREAYLRNAVRCNPELRIQVEALLAEDAAAGPLDRSIAEHFNTLAREVQPATGGTLRPGERLKRFRIACQIGAGGMGEVYRAQDERLGREVAIKRLPSEWARDHVARERLEREARAVSVLDHTNICTLYDLVYDSEDRPFLVLAYYEGQTLATEIARGPLPIERAVDIAAQVARGLACAHAAGIIHRDIKPENILVTDRGEAKILDFGIAKLAHATILTRSGVSPGTPAYMSPEQASGRNVDRRTDLWSLGVLLYEMVGGKLPFVAGRPEGMAQAILTRKPKPLRRVRAETPRWLERIVARSLAKDPKQRYKDAEALLDDLESGPRSSSKSTRFRTWWLVPAGVAAAIVSWFFVGSSPHQTGSSEPIFSGGVSAGIARDGSLAPESVATVGVVPFAIRPGDSELEWYGEGMARLLADALSSSRHVRVVAVDRVTSLIGDRRGDEATRVAAEHGVSHLLSGDVFATSDGWAVAARLISTSEGIQRAGSRFEVANLAALFLTVDTITREVQRGLGIPTVENVDVYAADFASEQPRAYEEFVHGLRNFAIYRFEEARDAFSKAIEIAPEFTMAHARLAYTEAVLGETEAAVERSRKAVLESSRLPDRTARYILAADAYITRNYDEAIARYQEIIERYPYEIEARTQLSLLLGSRRRFSDQLAILEELVALEPKNPSAWSQIGQVYLDLGRFQEALRAHMLYLDLQPGSANGHHGLGVTYRALGELDLAAREFQRACEIDPDFFFARIDLAVVDALRGRVGLAEEQLAALVADRNLPPRAVLDAAFELVALRRASGQFKAAETVLRDLEPMLAEEQVRLALALSIRGLIRLELGELTPARSLIDLAISKAPPGPKTRYLLARGLLERREGRWEDLAATTVAILEDDHAQAQSDQTRDRAVAYLRGLAALDQGRLDEAVEMLEDAVTQRGYQYRVYRVDLARSYLAAGRLPEALTAAQQAIREVELNPPRLDLHADRVHARLIVAKVHAALGNPEAARASSLEFLERWATADPELAETELAGQLAGETP